MLFNSFSFLAFFAVLAGVYYAVPHKFRWPLLLAASLYFYAGFRASYLFLLLGVTLVAYVGGLACISHQRLCDGLKGAEIGAECSEPQS